MEVSQHERKMTLHTLQLFFCYLVPHPNAATMLNGTRHRNQIFCFLTWQQMINSAAGLLVWQHQNVNVVS